MPPRRGSGAKGSHSSKRKLGPMHRSPGRRRRAVMARKSRAVSQEMKQHQEFMQRLVDRWAP